MERVPPQSHRTPDHQGVTGVPKYLIVVTDPNRATPREEVISFISDVIPEKHGHQFWGVLREALLKHSNLYAPRIKAMTDQNLKGYFDIDWFNLDKIPKVFSR